MLTAHLNTLHRFEDRMWRKYEALKRLSDDLVGVTGDVRSRRNPLHIRDLFRKYRRQSHSPMASSIRPFLEVCAVNYIVWLTASCFYSLTFFLQNDLEEALIVWEMADASFKDAVRKLRKLYDIREKLIRVRNELLQLVEL